MLSRLSHPLAFATAPLDGTAPEYGGESFFVVGDEGGHAGMGDTIVPITRSMAATMLDPRTPNHSSHPQTPHQQRLSNVDASQIDPRDSRKTLEEYAYENRQLKLAVDSLSKKVASYKEVLPSIKDEVDWRLRYRHRRY
jgi:predicted RNase H-like nuclease (RuvC/YqgF family)